MSLLYQTSGIRQLENRVYEQTGITPYGLMKKAAQAAFDELVRCYPKARSLTICCGKGNNGGDGLVLACLTAKQGYQVQVCMPPNQSPSTPCAQQALQDALDQGLDIVEFHADMLFSADVLVDALLGIGLKDAVREPYLAMIQAINLIDAPIFSLDVPSGLDSDTGCVGNEAVKADATVTFIANKPGLLTGKAPAHCGTIYVHDLGVPAELFLEVTPSAQTILWDDITPYLQKRKRDAHKGDHGHTLVIGGDYGMGGAVRMAAEAALRVGAGLVTVATRPEHVPIVSGTRPEIMCHQIAEPDDIDPLLSKCNVVVIGPGLGQADWAKGLLNKVMAVDCAKVLDADALNLLSQSPGLLGEAVITPHPGEAGRLLGCKTQDIQENRFAMLNDLVKRYDAVVALKGAGTLLGYHDELPQVCAAGNPGMATGGMGDVLTGVIGGLIAQGLPVYEATQAGVLVHATAADQAALQGGERGLLPTDLLDHLRELVNPYDHRS